MHSLRRLCYPGQIIQEKVCIQRICHLSKLCTYRHKLSSSLLKEDLLLLQQLNSDNSDILELIYLAMAAFRAPLSTCIRTHSVTRLQADGKQGSLFPDGREEGDRKTKVVRKLKTLSVNETGEEKLEIVRLNNWSPEGKRERETNSETS